MGTYKHQTGRYRPVLKCVFISINITAYTYILVTQAFEFGLESKK